MIRCEVLTELDQLRALAPEWNALLARMRRPAVTRTPYWNIAWWRTFGGMDGRRLCCLCFREGGRLVGLVPLLSRPLSAGHLAAGVVHNGRVASTRRWARSAFPLTRLELLGTGESDHDEICSEYLGIITAAGDEQRVAAALADALRRDLPGRWHELVLSALDGEDVMMPLLYERLEGIGDTSLDVVRGAPFVRLPQSWEAYLAGRVRSQRYRFRRALRRFETWSDGDYELVRARTLDDVERGKRILTLLHQARWNASGRTGVFDSDAFIAFHGLVMPELLEAGALDLSWLSVRGRPLAVQYSFIANNCVRFYQSGRAMTVPPKITIGMVMHLFNIRHAIECGRDEYDFLAGVRRYKMELAHEVRPVMQIRVLRRSAAAQLFDSGQRAVDWLRRFR